jgi:outer membrane protein
MLGSVPTKRSCSLKTSQSKFLSTIAAAWALLAAAGTAHAQLVDTDGQLPDRPAAGQDIGIVGASVRFGERSTGETGTRNHGVTLIPELGYYASSGWFASTTQGLGVNLSNSRDLQFGPRLTVDMGRRARYSDTLKGMGNIDPELEAGGFLNYSPLQNLWLTSSLRAGAGNDHNGVHIDLGANYTLALAPQWKLKLGGSTTVANQAYMQTYYGVNATQSAATGYAAYKPRAGFTDVSANATLSYAVTPRMTVSTELITRHLLGDAQDSPVTKKANVTTGQVGVNYAF